MRKNSLPYTIECNGDLFDGIKEKVRQHQMTILENSVEGLARQQVINLLYSKDKEDVAFGLRIGRNLNILQRGYSDNFSYDMWSPLHFASSEGDLELAQFLLDNGADINFQSEYNFFTPLHLAKNKKTYDFLLKSGANPKLKDASGWTPHQQFRSVPIKVALAICGLAISAVTCLIDYAVCYSLQKTSKEKYPCEQSLSVPLMLSAATVASMFWVFSGRPSSRVHDTRSQSEKVVSLSNDEKSPPLVNAKKHL